MAQMHALPCACSTLIDWLVTRHIVGWLQDREAILLKIADELEKREEEIMAENTADVEAAEGKIDDQLMNRLRLKPQKIKQLADGIRSIAAQDEPLRKVCITFAHFLHSTRALCAILHK